MSSSGIRQRSQDGVWRPREVVYDTVALSFLEGIHFVVTTSTEEQFLKIGTRKVSSAMPVIMM